MPERTPQASGGMLPLADLHIHTYFSDGTLSPEEVVSAAQAVGLGLLAVCDHNTAESGTRLGAACAKAGIAWLPGAEIDAAYEGGDRHVLALGCDFSDPALDALLAEHRRIMEQVSIDLIDRMSADDPRLSPAEYAAYERVPERGGWKGIDYLRSRGYEIAYPDCMKYYRQYACRPAPFTPLAEVCRIIRAAGGAAVIAHPVDGLREGTLAEHLPRWLAAGIDGLECYYPSFTAQQVKLLRDYCRQHGLLITGGCDCHGDFATDIDGTHYALGAVQIPTEWLALGRLKPIQPK